MIQRKYIYINVTIHEMRDTIIYPYTAQEEAATEEGEEEEANSKKSKTNCVLREQIANKNRPKMFANK